MEQHSSPTALSTSVARLQELLSNPESTEEERQEAIREARRRIGETLRRVSVQLDGVEESVMTARQKIMAGTRRAAIHVLSLLDDLAPSRTYPDPQVLAFDVLPEGEGPEVTEGDGESPDAGVGQDRVHWTIDVLRRMDPSYLAEGNFFLSESACDGGGTGYHVLLFPANGRAIFVSNVYGNATYVCPHEDWEVFARMTRGELRGCSGDWERNPRDPRALEVTRLKMSHVQDLRLTEEIWKERLRIELERNAGVLPEERRNTIEDTIERLRAFGEQHGHLPNYGSQDSYEGALLSFYAILRKSFGQETDLTPDRETLLKEMAREVHFANFIKELVAFHISHDRFPKYDAPSEAERKLATRLHHWAAMWRDGTLAESHSSRLKALGVRVPRAVQSVPYSERVAQYMEELRQFIFREKRLPCCSTETGTPERDAWNKMPLLRRAWKRGDLTREQAEGILRMEVPLVEGEEACETLAKLRASGPSNEGGKPERADDAVE